MTKQGKFWAASLLGASVVLGLAWVWLELSPHEPAPRSGWPEAALARGEKEADGRDFPLGRHQSEASFREAPETLETRRPHPITPLHEVMAERRALLGAIVQALEDQHFEAARALLGQAEELRSASDPSDPESSTFTGTVRGYHLILDCMAARAAAASGSRELPGELLEGSRKYLDQHRLPPRREVRRVCLEGRTFARRS